MTNDNTFLSLISSPLMNLDHTYRYSGTKLVEKETLSQHIVDTIMMGLKISDELNHLSENTLIFTDIYMKKAIYHDLEEVITGDIPRPLKYHDEDTLRSMRQVADEVARDLFNQEFHDAESAYLTWDVAKEGNEGFVLKIVDMLVVANKVVKEVNLLNNFYMLRVAHEVTQYILEVRSHVEEYIRYWEHKPKVYIYNLLDDAVAVMQEILIEHDSRIPLCGKSMI